MLCPRCNNNVPGDVRYCARCGFLLLPPEKAKPSAKPVVAETPAQAAETRRIAGTIIALAICLGLLLTAGVVALVYRGLEHWNTLPQATHTAFVVVAELSQSDDTLLVLPADEEAEALLGAECTLHIAEIQVYNTDGRKIGRDALRVGDTLQADLYDLTEGAEREATAETLRVVEQSE